MIGKITTSPIAALLAAALLTTLAVAPAGAAVFRVDTLSGADGSGCGTEASPCATIQQAVDLSTSGDTILVSQGTYVDSQTCSGEAAVICVFQKDLAILGGFASGNWSLPDPAAHTTVIDGQNVRRGIYVQGGTTGAAVRIEGFTVRNGKATGAPTVGGGLKANIADVVLRDMSFEDNVVTAEAGQLGGGGGAALLSTSGDIRTITLERVRFLNNQVTGGGGTGGVGQGGGLLVDYAVLDGLNLDFEGNTAVGGASSTDGKDGLGGGAAFAFGTTGTIRRLTATNNSATGGGASNTGGGAFGGAVFMEGDEDLPARETNLTILDSNLSGNTATGGAGSTKGGGGVGGAIDVFASQITLERTTVTGNTAQGGTQGASKANAGGGGVFLEWPFASTAPLNLIRDSIIADNIAEGSQGGGGGLRLLGARAQVTHATFVDNRIVGAGFGNGILVGPRFATNQESALTLAYSILADHTVPAGAAALHVQAGSGLGSSANLTSLNQFVGNKKNTNDGDANSGTFTGFPGSNILDASASTFFVNPAASDYHVDGTQPPTNSATGSSETFDVDGATRSGTRDLGADEFGAVAFGLSVGKLGVGTGTVTSSPAGISCGADCFESFADGANVNLTATPDMGFFFTGWSGDADCSDGVVLMTQDRSCTAQFEDQPQMCSVADTDLVLTGSTVNSTVTEKACNSITAGPSYTVGGPGNVTFEAPTIVLRSGFSVAGTFVAVNTVP